jgi:hypothetical protein
MHDWTARVRRWRYGVAGVVYALALVLCFHGILAHPLSHIYGLNDGTSSIRDYWAASIQHRTPFTITLDKLEGAPEGTVRTPATTLANGGIQAAFAWELRGPLGLIGAMNLFMLVGMFATGLATFALLDRLGATTATALLGGYVFAFSPYALERAYAGHLALLQNWIFPLLAGVLIRLRSRGTVLYALAAGATIALAFYLSAYEGLLAGFMTLIYLLVELANPTLTSPRRRTLLHAVTIGLVTILGLTPILALYANEQAAVSASTSHDSASFYVFSAQLSAYFIPSPRNPLLRWIHGHSSDLTEETLFFGYLTLILALVGVGLLLRRDRWLRASPGRWRTALFAAVLIPAAFVMSLPPSYRVGSVTVPMPSTLLRHLTTFWRAYSRFGLLVGFGLVVLATLALSALARRGGRWRLLTPLAALVIFLEILPGNVATLNAKHAPAWVTWLAHQPHGIVATYPRGAAVGLDDWYQVFDHDPEFQGPAETGHNGAIRLLARDLWRPLTAEVLATEGVRYLVVHANDFRQAGLFAGTPPVKDYRLLRRFGPVRIYAVHAPTLDLARTLQDNVGELMFLQGYVQPTLGYGGGFNAPEPFHNTVSRWMIQDGKLTITAQSASDIELSSIAFSNQLPRLLELVDSKGNILGRILVPVIAKKIRFGYFSVPAGTTTLTLVASPKPFILGANDLRVASVFLEPFTMVARATDIYGTARG